LREQAAPMTQAELQRRCLLRREEATELIGQLHATGRVLQTPDVRLAHPAVVEEAAARIVSAIQAFHTAQPQQAGIEHHAVRASVGGNADVFELAAASARKAGRIEFNGSVFALPGWKPRISDPEQQLSEQLAAAFQKARWAAPTPEELAATLGIAPERVAKLTRLLQERGELVRLDDRVLMHRDAVEAGKQIALRLFTRRPAFTTMDFRDALGVSRKFAVPLLDHLDRARFTVRSGNNRTPGAEAKKMMS